MYTDEDLDCAVTENIFSRESVADFRDFMARSKNTAAVDEENFKLISGFNDIYVVIACLLLLISSSWVLKSISEVVALFALPLISWGLAEFFVRKRKMALPAIVLLLSFVGGAFALGLQLFEAAGDSAVIVASAFAAFATFVHWQRFKVPITIAVGGAAIVGVVISSALTIMPSLEDSISSIIFVSGLVAFLFAMYWDSSDLTRTSHHSDVAFWLHLFAAPLIVHPVFLNLGMLTGDESMAGIITIIVLYIVMTLISIVIDRRAFMVSSLAYVLYALSEFLEKFGSIDYGFAMTGTIIGAVLLLLSAFWHPARVAILNTMPESVKRYVPVASQ